VSYIPGTLATITAAPIRYATVSPAGRFATLTAVPARFATLTDFGPATHSPTLFDSLVGLFDSLVGLFDSL
jgi:hypothetical protein